MRAGRIEQVGAPLDLYDRPVNTFVAGFIGSPKMNFLPVEGGGDAGRRRSSADVVFEGGTARRAGRRSRWTPAPN